jgi:hypothetical protein
MSDDKCELVAIPDAYRQQRCPDVRPRGFRNTFEFGY